uniref:Ig-like domain-containing protein n=1 Tax=Anabas testudineus TaxID=64144 RepID=A0AAQ6IIC5_ANATE
SVLMLLCISDVTLQCKSPRDDQILLLRWSRPDLGSNEYVIYFRQNRLNEDYQHERFRGRVKLKDPNMKDGDFSVILKNVTVRDTGTYECSVGYGGNPELINTINLTVEPGELVCVCIMSDRSLKRKWILLCSSLITYLTPADSLLLLICR